MKKLFLFPGCVIYSRLPHIEALTLKSFNTLGIKLQPLKGFTCCPEPFAFKTLSEKAWYALAARNLSLAEAENGDILTVCNGCTYTLHEASKGLKRDEKLQSEVNQVLAITGRSFKGEVEVLSFVRYLYEKVGVERIKRYVKNPLIGVKAALHHGCHLFEELEEYDDVRRPRSFKGLVEALGLETVEYPSETLCCGAFLQAVEEKLHLEVLREKLGDVKAHGATCLVVSCPTCYLQYDLGQLQIKRKLKEDYNIPVFHYVELLALSLGLPVENLIKRFHTVPIPFNVA
ncbi:MAG: heterodisulfide reductase-related iron-sulfur binding cluster [Candidatus Nezhaarchaeales archaeon]